MMQNITIGAELDIDKVNVTYKSRRGDVNALSDLSFRVRRGEFVSVLGPSGCGKSTLLRLASGLMQPTSGELRLNGDAIMSPRPDVGIVFQKPTLLPWKSVLSNVLVPIRALKRSDRDYMQTAMDLLRLVGLQDFPNHFPNELSGGMQQRVAIARGFIHDPNLLLMDEPFAALDAMTRESMMLELQKIWMSKQKSVLFITHSIPEAVFLSDRIIVMSNRPGRVMHEIDVNIPRPRNIEDMGSSAFTELAGKLRRLFIGL